MKKISIFFDEEGVKFSFEKLLEQVLVGNLLPAKPAKRLVKSC